MSGEASNSEGDGFPNKHDEPYSNDSNDLLNESKSSDAFNQTTSSDNSSFVSADTPLHECDDELPSSNANESMSTEIADSASDSDDDNDDDFAGDFAYSIGQAAMRSRFDLDDDSDNSSDDSSRYPTQADKKAYSQIKSEMDTKLKLGGYSMQSGVFAVRYNPLSLLHSRQLCGHSALGFTPPTFRPYLNFEHALQVSPSLISKLSLYARYDVHNGCVNALNFNSDGTLLASGSDDLHVNIVNWVSGEQVYKYRTGHRMNVFEVKFLPDCGDLQVVTCSRDGEVRLAVLSSTGVCRTTRALTCHSDACHKFALPSGEPSVILSAGEDCKVKMCDVRQDKAIKVVSVKKVPLYSISSNPVKTQEFCVVGKDEWVRVFDRRMLAENNSSNRYPCMLKLCPQNLRPNPPSKKNKGDDVDESKASTSAESKEETGKSDDYDDSTTSEEDDDSDPESEENRRERRRRNFQRYILSESVMAPYSITSCKYSHDGKSILASYNDEDIYLLDATDESKPPLHRYMGHRNNQTVKGVNFFGSRCEYVMSGSDDGHLYLWDRESEGLVQWLHADRTGVVNVLEAHPTMPVIASSGLDSDVKVWSPHQMSDDLRQKVGGYSIRSRRNVRRTENCAEDKPKASSSTEKTKRPRLDYSDLPYDVSELKKKVARNWFKRKQDESGQTATANLLDLMRIIMPPRFPMNFVASNGSDDSDDDDTPSRRRRRNGSGSDGDEPEVNNCRAS